MQPIVSRQHYHKAAAKMNNINILLIEDSKADAKLVEFKLRDSTNFTYNLTHVQTLTAGLKVGNNSEFEVALLDMHLPDSSGMETVEAAVKRLPKKTPIIVLTGMDDESLGLKVLKAGAQDYLVKDRIDTHSLVRAILHAMQRQKMKMELEVTTRHLTISERRLLQAQHIAHIGNYELHPKSGEMYWSDELYYILGYDKNQVPPHVNTYYELIPKEQLKKLRKVLQSSIAQKKDFSFDHSVQLPNAEGELRCLRNRGQFVKDFNTGKPLLIGTIQDITLQKMAEQRLRQSEEKFRTIFEQSQDSIFIIKPDKGCIMECNKSMLQLFGYTSEDMKQMCLGHFFKNPENFEFFKREMNKNGSIKDYEVQLLKKNGEEVAAMVSATTWHSLEGASAYHGIIRDITAIRQTQQLVKEKELAQHSAYMKERFLANMSHEIRTPMNVVVGMTHLLEQTNLNFKQKDYINALKLSSKNLLRLINSILDFSKIEAGKLELEQRPFQINELINQLAQTYKYVAQEKDVEFYTLLDAHLPATVIGDSMRLYQVLNNLISNALKYTEKGEIKIKVKMLKGHQQYHNILFEVSDTGIGIDADKLETIFDTFTQANEQTSRLYGGTGLGLSIAKKTVELFGGSIKAESEPGKGSVFSFNVKFYKKPDFEPISATSGENDDMAAHQSPTNKTSRILLVEDHKLNQLVASDLLKNWDKNVVIDIAENGREAIEILRKSKAEAYDVILMDISMPEMDGYQATRYIRSQMPAPINETPIIAMTAHAFNINAKRCYDVGMNEFVSKPIHPEVLYEKLHHVLKSKSDRPLQTQQAPAAAKQIKDKKKAAPSLNLDLEYLEKLASNDISVKTSMLETIAKGLPTELRKVMSDFENRQWDELKASVHKLKATCNYLGLESSAKLAKRIETAAWKRNIDDQLAAWVKQLERNCQTAQKQVNEELEKLHALS